MNDDWTWSEAGEQALYRIISVFVILILLTLLNVQRVLDVQEA